MTKRCAPAREGDRRPRSFAAAALRHSPFPSPLFFPLLPFLLPLLSLLRAGGERGGGEQYESARAGARVRGALVPCLRCAVAASTRQEGHCLVGNTMETASHSLILLQQLNMQREFGFLCDCTVAIGDVYFKAHRAVLAAFSNYFKMIFIHQTSDCIKIQPTDIQPDIFSYLLHIMYTGKGPKQIVNQTRLEEGIHFLHADYLSRMAVEMNQMLSPESVQSSNLYGIQISTTHKSVKEGLQAKESLTSVGSRTASQSDHPQLQLSLAIGLDDGSLDQQLSRPSLPAAAKPAEELPNPPVTIKQEKSDPEQVVSQSHTASSPDVSGPAFSRANLKVHLCQYCGEHFESRSSLREHLFTHVSGSLPFGVPASILESSDLAQLQPLHENHEAAEIHRLGSCLRNEDERRLEHPAHGSLEPLPIGQLSLVSKDSEPVELNCNFSFSRKRKISCAVCGHKFLRKSQLLEHMYTHKGKHFKLGRCQRLGGSAAPKFQLLGSSWTPVKGTALSQAHVDSQNAPDPDLSQESIDTILVE